MSIAKVIEDFLFHCSVERRLAKNTIQAYDCDLRHFDRFTGDQPIEQVHTVETVKRYLSYLICEKELSTATARRRMACLHSFFGFVERTRGLSSPFHDWSPSLRRPSRLPKAVSRRDIRALINPSADRSEIDRDTVFAVLAISVTGVRVSEFCGIKTSDVSPDGMSIRIMGKGQKDRIVYVSDEKLRKIFVEKRVSQMELNGEHARLLVNSRGRPLQPQTLRRRLRKLAEKSGLQCSITPHMLRHTAATLLIESGIDIRFVQRLLGHSSIATTEIYTHVSDVSLKRAVFQANTIELISATNMDHF